MTKSYDENMRPIPLTARQIIYVPTEANIPITEAGRR